MGFFNWAAPFIRRYGDRFTADDAETIAGWLRQAVEPGGRVLDVGGGSGQLAALLAGALQAYVTVLEPTAEIIAYVNATGHVSAVQGAAEEMPLPTDGFDAIVVIDAFHHFGEQTAAVAEFRRVVRDGGLVLVLDLDPRPLVMRLIALAERLVGEPATFMTPEEMCAFMAERGIEGRCQPLRNAGYRFLGTVRKQRPAA